MGDLGGLLGASWEHLGASWKIFEGLGSLLETSVKHVSLISKTFKNHCKNIDFSMILMSRGAEHDDNICQDGNKLAPSEPK